MHKNYSLGMDINKDSTIKKNIQHPIQRYLHFNKHCVSYGVLH